MGRKRNRYRCRRSPVSYSNSLAGLPSRPRVFANQTQELARPTASLPIPAVVCYLLLRVRAGWLLMWEGEL